MSSFDDFLEDVERGREGLNEGIPIGLGVFGQHINLLPSTYYLVGGESSTGKTSFVDTIIINCLDKILLGQTNKKLKIFYYSFEIDEKRKIAKWCCIWLWKKYGILLSSKQILGKNKYRINDDTYSKIVESRNYFNKIIGDIIVFHDSALHPTGVYSKVRDYCESVGKLITISKKTYNGIEYKRKKYIPNNPNEIVLSIKDHVGYLRIEKNAISKKDRLDLSSYYNVVGRNKYGISSIDISQFNRSLADMQRQRFKELMPQPDDFKDSGNMYEDSDVTIGLFNPMKHGLKQYANYNISELGKRLRFGVILKNRDGDDNIRAAFNFCGEIGYYRNVPKSEDLSINPLLVKKVIEFSK